MSGRSPPLYCTLTLIAMQGHRQEAKINQKQCSTSSNMVTTIYCFIGCKDKASTSTWYLYGFPDGINLGYDPHIARVWINRVRLPILHVVS